MAEIAFEKYTMVYPDANTYSQEHIDLVDSCALTKGRHLLHSYVRCLQVPAHEVLRFIQSALKIKDLSVISWSAEHDASFACLSLLKAVDRAGTAPQIFTEGLVEACFMYMHQSQMHRMDKMFIENCQAW